MTFEELAAKSTSESMANLNRMDRFTYRWGFVFRMRPKKVSGANRHPLERYPVPAPQISFYDKTFIENLKLNAPLVPESYWDTF